MLTVKQRQCNLQFLNYDCGCGQPFEVLKVDGIEGQKTIQAYKNFQRDFGLKLIDRNIWLRNRHTINAIHSNGTNLYTL